MREGKTFEKTTPEKGSFAPSSGREGPKEYGRKAHLPSGGRQGISQGF